MAICTCFCYLHVITQYATNSNCLHISWQYVNMCFLRSTWQFANNARHLHISQQFVNTCSYLNICRQHAVFVAFAYSRAICKLLQSFGYYQALCRYFEAFAYDWAIRTGMVEPLSLFLNDHSIYEENRHQKREASGKEKNQRKQSKNKSQRIK